MDVEADVNAFFKIKHSMAVVLRYAPNVLYMMFHVQFVVITAGGLFEKKQTYFEKLLTLPAVFKTVQQ